MERKRCENRRFLSRVVSFDIRAAVFFGVSEFLRHRERVLHRFAQRVNAIKDEVSRPVYDSKDSCYSVPREGIAKRTDDGNRTGDGGFVVDLRANLGGGLKNLGAVVREQRLIRSDDVSARVDCVEDQRARGLDAAHEFNHDVRLSNESGGIGRDEVRRDIDRALRFRVAYGNTNQFDSRSNSRGQLVTVIENLVRDLRANASRTEQRDSKVSIFNQWVFLNTDGPAGIESV